MSPDDRPPDESDEEAQDAPVELALGDTLDLHAFAPRDVAALVEHYLGECAAAGFSRVRLVHGKGIGALRATVRRVLERHPDVAAFETADESGGGWGATLVTLRRRTPA